MAKIVIKPNFNFLNYKLLLGLVLLVLGTCSLIWTPFQLLMDERIRMTRGLPPFEWWKTPPDEVFIRVYLFNVTNSERFLNGTDTKLNFEEIGQLIFLEKLIHSNVTFNANSTLTYVAERRAIFLPELNSIELNATLIVPNWALLGIASYLSEASFFVKFGFNLLVRTIAPQPFVALSVDQFLWNFTDPMLDAAKNIAPFLVPIGNLGILARIYSNFINTVTVYIGAQHGHEKFFLIDQYDGTDQLPNYGYRCQDKVTNSTEGVAYPQFLTKQSVLKYWRNTFCKNAELTFEHEVTRLGIPGYKYTLQNTTFDRTEPSEADCYKSEPALLDGLTDVSRCHFDFPMASSFPHYLYGDSKLRDFVTGLKPDRDMHESYVIVEPLTGIPLQAMARSQSNLIVRKLTGFHSVVTNFSDTVIPMFWMEYNQRGLPWYILALLYFQVNVLPLGQRIAAALLVIGGGVFLMLYVRKLWCGYRQYLTDNKLLYFEKELFIDK